MEMLYMHVSSQFIARITLHPPLSIKKKKKAKMKCIYKTSILRTEYVLSQKIKNNFYAHKNIKDAY